MVLGSIVNWVVFRTLDLTAYTAWWLTKTTVSGVYYVGKYLVVPKNKNQTQNQFHIQEHELFEMIPIEYNIEYMKQQNDLLRQQNTILKNQYVPLDI
jgi:hypothetical protein